MLRVFSSLTVHVSAGFTLFAFLSLLLAFFPALVAFSFLHFFVLLCILSFFCYFFVLSVFLAFLHDQFFLHFLAILLSFMVSFLLSVFYLYCLFSFCLACLLSYLLYFLLFLHERSNSAQNYSSVIIYSPSCHFKPVRCSFCTRT